jgi:uncharacterized membrane protein YfcA
MDLPIDFTLIIAIGFAAQLIDGALGMAYGVTASALLLVCGIPPALSSATVHAAECFTTGASAASHHAFGNIDRQLFGRLVLPGMAGAAAGAYLLGSIDGEALKPWIAAYLLLMGLLILYRVWRRPQAPKPVRHLSELGFGGALLDAIGGGGWGPIVSGTLLARGQAFRLTVGTVNAAEFFVTATASAVFLLTLGSDYLRLVAGLAIGGVLAAPIGAWAVRRLDAQLMLGLVGTLVVALSLGTLYQLA